MKKKKNKKKGDSRECRDGEFRSLENRDRSRWDEPMNPGPLAPEARIIPLNHLKEISNPRVFSDWKQKI